MTARPWVQRPRDPRRNKERGIDYENAWAQTWRKGGYVLMHARGSMSDKTDVDWVVWMPGLSMTTYFVSCKDDGRGCRSARNLLLRLAALVPQHVAAMVVHSKPGRRFCEHV